MSASRPAHRDDELAIHFVNYNREEPARDGNGRPGTGGGIVDEKPIQADSFMANIVLPEKRQVEKIESATPESNDVVEIPFKLESGHRLRFEVPEFLVYRITRIRLRAQ